MRALGLILVVLLPGMAICQPKPAFEIADVHVSPRSEWARTVADTLQGGYLAGERYELHRATMLDLIGIAYNMDAESVYGGPGWLEPVPLPAPPSPHSPDHANHKIPNEPTSPDNPNNPIDLHPTKTDPPQSHLRHPLQ